MAASIVDFKTNPERQPMQYAIQLLEQHREAKRNELRRYEHNKDIAYIICIELEDLTRALEHIKE